MPRRIDTHHHIVPACYADWLTRRGISAGGLPIPSWSPEASLDLMDQSGIERAYFSVSTPGVHLGDDAEARAMARNVNEAAAEVVSRHPGRFGFFATLTLPDVEGALSAVQYAYDVLHADGVVLLTSVRGTYLGDPSFEPLMEELDRRRAVVFVHPCEPMLAPVPGIPPFAADFLLDTTRAAINMARAGWLERYSRVRIILSHAGGFVPFAAERIGRNCSEDGSIEGGIRRLRRFYFDTALSSSPYALPSLLAFADPEHILFGSDWPYAPAARSLHFSRLLDEYSLTDAQRLAVNRGNAERLFAGHARETGPDHPVRV